jgi:hypothetical protein
MEGKQFEDFGVCGGLTETSPIKIQGVYGGKFNILEGASISHCKKKVNINVFLILYCYLDRAVLIYKCKSIVNCSEGK